MRKARRRRGVLRPSKVTLRVVTIIVLLAWLGTTHPAPAVAQIALDCSTTGFCVSSTIDRLLGLPNGTLRFAPPVQPWDLVVKGPAMLAWAPLEADARAALAGIHGVPNDIRLPYAATDEIRGFMFMRLMELARRSALIKQFIAEGQQNIELTMSAAEIEAVEMLHQLVKNRRVRVVKNAQNEYKRWQDDPCHYTVSAGFDFEEYEPGPACGLEGQILFGPPSPPTADQFLQYGSARASQQDDEALRIAKMAALGIDASETTFVYNPQADMIAAFKDGAYGATLAAGVGLAVAVAGAAAVLAVAYAGVATTFATISVSYSVFGGVAAATAGAAVTGIGIAASLPAIVILCAVVSVIRGLQVADDYRVPTRLEEALTLAMRRRTPGRLRKRNRGKWNCSRPSSIRRYRAMTISASLPSRHRSNGNPATPDLLSRAGREQCCRTRSKP